MQFLTQEHIPGIQYQEDRLHMHLDPMFCTFGQIRNQGPEH